MKTIEQFFVRIRDSFYNPAAYSTAKTSSLGHRYLFVFLVGTLLMYISLIPFFVTALPAVQELRDAKFVDTAYPDGLEVTIAGGKASTNVEEPYFIPVPEEDRAANPQLADVEHYLVIDTRPDTTVEMLATYNAAVILTRDNVIANTEGRVFPLAGINELKVTKDSTRELMSQIMGVITVLMIPLALIVPPLLAVFLTLWHGVASVVGALLVMLAGSFRKTKLTYGESYKIALFATVPVMVVQTAAYFVGISVIPYFLDAALFFVIVLINLNSRAESA